MLGFKQHIILTEELLSELKIPQGGTAAFRGMDIKFLRSVMGALPNPKIPFSSFESLKNKKEIQFLYRMSVFAGIQHQTLPFKSIGPKSIVALNKEIDKLKSSSGFNYLYRYAKEGGGIGPGEVLLYYLLDNAILAGTNDTGDLRLGSNSYEVKAAEVSSTGSFRQFQIGGTIKQSIETPQQLKLVALYNKLMKTKVKEITAKQLGVFKEKYPKEWSKWRGDFSRAVHKGYFSKHPILFINAKTAEVAAVMNVKPTQIDVYRVMQRGIDYLVHR